MSVITKIAYRNIREHKTKTLIIGIIIAFGIMILVTGNSIMDTAAAGIEKNYIGNYTGHVVVHARTGEKVSIFGTMRPDNLNSVTETIPGYEEIEAYLQESHMIEEYNPQVLGKAMVTLGDSDRSLLQFFGIDPEAYRGMFPENMHVVEGEFIEPGEEGLMLSTAVKRELERSFGRPVGAGDSLLLTGMNPTSGTKVREIEIRGVFRFRESNPQLDMMSFIDLDTARTLNGMTVGGQGNIVLSEDEEAFLSGIDEGDLFGRDGAAEGAPAEAGSRSTVSEDELLSILGDTRGREKLSVTDSKAYHHILIKLSRSGDMKRAVNELNGFFTAQGIEAEASPWVDVAGIAAEMADSIQVVFNIIVIIIVIVAVIIIMNTLIISITERIGEIGTMRAIGATKGNVRGMILWETFIISCIFGGIGLAAGGLILLVLSLTGIEATNMFFRVIFGGQVLHPVLSLEAVGLSLAAVLGIGVLSSLYPVSVALKINPVSAMQKG